MLPNNCLIAFGILLCYVTHAHCQLVDVVERKNGSAEPSAAPTTAATVNLDFCAEKPKFWAGRGSFLTYLMRLKLCSLSEGKTWFAEACETRVYAFTHYYNTAYLRFCHPRLYHLTCPSSTSRDPQAIVDWWMARNNVSTVAVTTQQRANLSQPVIDALEDCAEAKCQQIDSYFESLDAFYPIEENVTSLVYDVNKTVDYAAPFATPNFTEWFLAYRPFCEPVACGTSLGRYGENPLSSYNCFPAPCKSGIIFVMVFDSLLAAVVVLANVLVLAVAARTPVMRNIPGYFKISLAVADLMVGIFVLPGSVYQNYVLYIDPLPYRAEGQRPKATDYFDQRYLNFMGVFTVLSFSMSIYTMGAASVDRYLAITKPFRYRQGAYLTTKRSAAVFACIWFFGLVCATYPVFTRHQYDISALSLVLATGTAATVVYVVTLGIPLIAVWVINSVMLRQVCTDGKNRRSISGNHQTVTSRLSATSNSGNPPNNNNSTKVETRNESVTKEKEFKGNKLSKFARSVHTTIKRRSKWSHGSVSSSSLANQANVEKKLARTLAIMVGAFTVAILPAVIVLALLPALQLQISPRSFPETYSPLAMNIVTSAEYIAARLFLSNSFWNCVIYSARNRHFRRAVVDAFICDEARMRRRRRSASMTTSSSRDRKLRKTASTESGCLATDERQRRGTQVIELEDCGDATPGGQGCAETVAARSAQV